MAKKTITYRNQVAQPSEEAGKYQEARPSSLEDMMHHDLSALESFFKLLRDTDDARVAYIGLDLLAAAKAQLGKRFDQINKHLGGVRLGHLSDSEESAWHSDEWFVCLDTANQEEAS